MPGSYVLQLEAARQAALRAGELLREEFHRLGGPRGAAAHAGIDEIAEAEILRLLSAAFPDYGYRGEELGLRNSPRDPGLHTWVVDPNDGTGDYLRGFRGSSVSIALLRAGKPVLGLVYAYCAPDSGGDLIAWSEGGAVVRNGLPVAREWPREPTEASTVLVSTYADFKMESNARAVLPMRFRGMPSIAYRLATIAAGEADATVALNSPHSWDYAAGHALLAGANANLMDGRGTVVAYTVDGYSDCAGALYGGPETLTPGLRERDWRGVARGLRDGTMPFILPVAGRAVASAGLLSRAQGCLLGQLAGDSLGSTVESYSPGRIAAENPRGLTRLRSGGVWGTIAGQPTDDSEMALALGRSMVRAGGYDAEQAARAYLVWYRSQPPAIGPTTATVLARAERRVREGCAAAAACRESADNSSESNGALMRVSPIGIAYAPERAWEAARRDAELTHASAVCGEASAVFAAAVSYAIRSGSGPPEIFEWSLQQAAVHGAGEPVQAVLRNARTQAPGNFMEQPGRVPVALQNAFYQLLHANGPESGVIDTVARGGDTDTNAAIAGALLGAAHGLRRLPWQWVDRVLTARPIAGLPGVSQPRPRDCWPVDALCLAERLLLIEA